MKNLKIIFYSLGIITFIIFIIIRYNNILNGYLLFIPLTVTLGLLITISILSLIRKIGIKGFIYEWIFLIALATISMLLIKFV